jgi:hypothetical protein
MDRRCGAYGTAVVGLLLGIGGECAAAEANPARPLVVSVIDRTDGNREVVMQATGVVTAIYRRIGVETVWVPCAHPMAADTRFRRLRVVIDSGAMVRGASVSPKVMGFASMSRERSSDIAFILYDRVRVNAARSRVDVAGLLGHVIAHELGHLLLPFNSHARHGIMRGEWEREDYERAARGLLFFDEPQGALIRRSVGLIDGTRQDDAEQ